MPGTAAQLVAWLEARLGKGYSEVLDGGVGPDFFDCSGLTEKGMEAIGFNFSRTTYSQWGDMRYLHLPARTPLIVGDLVYMHVAGEPDPGHVGVYVGNGQYINAPGHTGAVVRIEAIPDTISEHVFGIIRPAFAIAPAPTPAPAPAPPAPVPQEDDMAFQYGDPETGKVIATDANGNLYVEPGVPDLSVTTLSQHPEWKAGEAESAGQNPCVGVVPWKDPSGRWGYAYVTKPAGGTGSLGPYGTYHIGRDGTPH